MDEYLINEGSKNLIFETPTSDNRVKKITGKDLFSIINLAKKIPKTYFTFNKKNR